LSGRSRRISDEDFVAAWTHCRFSPVTVSTFLEMPIREVYRRRASLAKSGVYLQSVPVSNGGPKATEWQQAFAYRARQNRTIKDGWLCVWSDAHYWPGDAPVAHSALLLILKEFKPKLIIGNGDIFDGARVSRHEPMGWQKLPTVIEELDCVKLRLSEMRRASPKSETLRTIGNHCSRFDRRLATEVGEFEDVPGMRLSDHLKDWPDSYTVMINEEIDPVFVLHNIRGGMYAPANNVRAAGCTVITGHLHSQKSIPVTTLMQDMEGIDAGCLADVDHPAFAYAMDRPRDWRAGFVMMKFDAQGRRMPAEFCRVQWTKKYARAVWRSEVIYEKKL